MTADTQAQGDLPELPEARIESYQIDATMRRTTLHTYDAEDMREYGRACVAAALQGRAQEGEPSDTERLDWLVGQDNCVVNEGTNGFWLCWIDENDPNRTEYQKGSLPTAREAIDAARAALAQASRVEIGEAK